MSIVNMERITWKKIDNLDKNKSVIFVALSPIEEHGPHLPLGTDYISAKDLLKAVIDNLEKQNNAYNYIIHPSFPIGYNECVMNYPGTISFKSKTIENIIMDLGESISRVGFKKMVIVNHHLDLGHIKAIENAKDILNKECSLKVLEVASSIIYSQSKKENAKIVRNDLDMEREIHADVRETSFMLFKHPELVKDCYSTLEPIYMDMKEFIKSNGRCWREYGIEEGYIGSPAKGSKEKGKVQFEDMVKNTVELIFKFIQYGYMPELSKKIKIAMNYMILR
ncbi:creatininase family protein [Clostridium botulinum]|uniref:Creatininase family protein n=1 Tax=Clostridium botulinum TaxID=1491 RepID=A0A6G4HVK2_CLOBO|nr:creatininase family protein [Clostridium botulinum]MBD5588876.1 creatininase family protein [Clostridium botulinum]NFJ60039.1 creatininase family protein [Clostridium botulinum]NFJ66914.1 creatininase family protein [Clostridium botulinum]NFM78465.1 creatininase family protein [Clostridium botulinum]NFQ64805.1 creatininase family protein [Clostridium botulinum]